MKALEIARLLIARSRTDYDQFGGELITNLKLQKMLYYQQGHHLAKFGVPLFEDDIEAWMYGPVVPEVYRKYKDYGSDPITEKVSLENLPKLKDEESDLFEEVYISYNRYSAIGLVNLSHSEKPWKDAVRNDETNARPGLVIPMQKISEFFRGKLV